MKLISNGHIRWEETHLSATKALITSIIKIEDTPPRIVEHYVIIWTVGLVSESWEIETVYAPAF